MHIEEFSNRRLSWKRCYKASVNIRKGPPPYKEICNNFSRVKWITLHPMIRYKYARKDFAAASSSLSLERTEAFEQYMPENNADEAD